MFIQVTTECYLPLESVRRGESKTVGPSVSLSACNCSRNAYPFIINSRKIIRISDKKIWHPLEDNEAIFKKIIFNYFRPNFRKLTVYLLLLTSTATSGRLICCISGERD